jgi:Ras-related GTP-binding protein A/B
MVNSKHTGIPAGNANFAELQIKTGRFMFFITRLTENTNLAVTIPPYEHIFNAARINISLIRHRFAELDVATRKKVDVDARDESAGNALMSL